MTLKNRSKKGDGNPVTEQPLYVEADPNGSRRQRRLWKMRHGARPPEGADIDGRWLKRVHR